MSETISSTIGIEKDVKQKFEALKNEAPKMSATAAKQRKAMLKKLLKVVMAKRNKIQDALYADYDRSPIETDIADTWVVVKEIKYAIKNLDNWITDKHVSTPLAFFGASSLIQYEPKGVVLIISPWNFPFNLTLSPLVSAIAAGNTVMVKPSEFTTHSSHLIREIIVEAFPPDVVNICEGSVDTAKELLKLPFNHIFFTGSPGVGKKVMKAAADNLASVTLELGGKSPAIVDGTVNLKKTAKMLAQSKFYNKGQICIATDYVFVHQSIAEEFGEAVTEALNELYPEDQFQKNRDYARLVDERHMHRITSMVDDAIGKGAKTLTKVEVNEEDRFVSPVVVSDVTADMLIDQEEIFGPIMPIKSFSNLDEVIDAINAGEKPLAMYVFSKKKKVQTRILKETSAGAVVINEVSVHHFNSELPFGGVNNSGIGKSHGYFGFLEFTNQKAVVKQWSPFNMSALLQPPYTGFTKWLVDKLLRYF